MHDVNEIKKALYKQKPIAIKDYVTDAATGYQTKVEIEGKGVYVQFSVPAIEARAEVFVREMEAHLLIRWMKQPVTGHKI